MSPWIAEGILIKSNEKLYKDLLKISWDELRKKFWKVLEHPGKKVQGVNPEGNIRVIEGVTSERNPGSKYGWISPGNLREISENSGRASTKITRKTVG